MASAGIPGDPVIEEGPCPPHRRTCRQACSTGACQGASFQKMVCMGYAIKHGICKLTPASEEGVHSIEGIINITGYEYGIDLDECPRVCPLNGVGANAGIGDEAACRDRALLPPQVGHAESATGIGPLYGIQGADKAVGAALEAALTVEDELVRDISSHS